MINAYRAGEAIYLRPLERADAERLAGWFNDEQVRRHLERYLPMSVQREIEFIDALLKTSDLVLGIVTVDGDVLVGVTGLHDLHPRNHAATFGICIGEKAEWRRGYATEATRLMVAIAFDTLNLHRVELRVDADHVAAQKVYERVGFKREGVLRQAAFRAGGWQDEWVMAILREEWGTAGVART
jgi:RimJ/RimL family protein N-acetyltransferase